MLDFSGGKEIVITDFKDTIGEVREEKGLYTVSDFKDYRKKVEKYIREHEDHIAIHKLKRNKPITMGDIQELEKMLFNGNDLGTKEDFEQTFGTDKPLGYFIRSIIGLDRTAAKEAFSAFFHVGNLTGDQLTFLNQIINYLTHNGVMSPGVLFDPPFTDIHSHGINGVFNQEDAEEITEIIYSINKNAEAA